VVFYFLFRVVCDLECSCICVGCATVGFCFGLSCYFLGFWGGDLGGVGVE